MKGLEANIIWIVVLALVSIIVLLSLITKTIQPAAYRIYCNIYFKITRFFSGVETSSIPAYCKQYITQQVEVVEIRDQDNKIFSRRLLAYIIACWKETEIKELYNETHTCYELHLVNAVENVTEENVTQILINEDRCKSIENSDYGCGVMDQIIWDIGDVVIKNQKIILIEYDHEKDAIRVIG